MAMIAGVGSGAAGEAEHIAEDIENERRRRTAGKVAGNRLQDEDKGRDKRDPESPSIASCFHREVPPGRPRGVFLDHDPVSLKRHHALALCLSMLFSESRYPFFKLML